MNKINELGISKTKAAQTSAQTTIYSDAVDMAMAEGVIFHTIMPAVSGTGNFIKVQSCPASDFAAAVVDVEDAKVTPVAAGDMCAIDVCEPPHRYVRLAVVRAGVACVTNEVYAIKYGVPKMPTSNTVTGVTSTAVAMPDGVTPVGNIKTPTISSPADDATGVALNATISGSAYAVVDSSAAHEKSQFQIAVVPAEDPIDWDTAVVDQEKTTATLIQLALAGTELENSTEYAVRVRYYSATLGWSDWGTENTFTTAAA